MDIYQYSPLSSDLHIRLFKLNLSPISHDDPLSLELVEAHLFDNGSFEALSYTWGDLNDSVAVNVGDHLLMITPNLLSFLKRLREEERNKSQAAASMYWADQICINQQDIPERNRQVALMSSIYRESRTTLVWLGEAGDGVHAALELLRDVDLLGYGENDPRPLALPRVVQVTEARLCNQGAGGNRTESELLDLFNRAWFTRSWVIQEVAVAVACTVRVSEHLFRWESLDLAVIGLATIDKKRRGILSGSPMLKTAAAAALRHIQYCRKRWTSRNAERHRHDFLYLLGRLSPTMACTDPRDRVYAYLSLQEEPRVLEADYTLSVDDVFIKTSATLAAASRRLDIFAYTTYPPIGSGKECSQLPSWAIDWRMPNTMSRLRTKADSSFCASGSYEYNPIPSGQLCRILRVRGKVIDMVGATLTGHEFPRTGDSVTLMRCLTPARIFEMTSHLCAVPGSPAEQTSLYHRAVKVLLRYDRKLDDADGQWNENLESALRITEAYQTNGQLSQGESSQLKEFTSKTNRKSVRTFYITRQRKLLGLSPPLSRTGDLVCIVHGSRTPVILRRSAAPGQFHVLGQSYLEGWMHGTHVTWREDEADVFGLV
ncbi:HET domain-containing protein [Aspergillus lucknowensis]|uniref:Heterokaryon incompatibility protein-domain-containing protein n=1 Tax=Aspergillus lucknowensis TaxID=176173 RepID=A0ABR4M0A2_9EURO